MEKATLVQAVGRLEKLKESTGVSRVEIEEKKQGLIEVFGGS